MIDVCVRSQDPLDEFLELSKFCVLALVHSKDPRLLYKFNQVNLKSYLLLQTLCSTYVKVMVQFNTTMRI